MSVGLLAKYYFKIPSESKINLYVPAGLNFVINRSKLTMQGKMGSFRMTSQELTNALAFNAGIGAQFNLGKPLLFIESDILCPVISKGSRQSLYSVNNPNEIPVHAVLAIGLKLPLP